MRKKESFTNCSLYPYHLRVFEDVSEAFISETDGLSAVVSDALH